MHRKNVCLSVLLICTFLHIYNAYLYGDEPFPFGCFFAQDECPNEYIQFWLYKNESINTPLLLDVLNLNASTFAPLLPLKILLHGYYGHSNHTPNLELRPLLLQTQPVHVISVEYGRLVSQPCYYPWALQNARVVAKCLAQLMDNLIEAHIYEAEQIHLIGFSLGAQIAGLAANYAQHALKRITGLDPAGPGFQTNILSERLDASDAEFIDVIHTDPFFYSSLEPFGHADFYPNLERLFQPGCNVLINGPLAGLRNCNHFRAPKYYAESITTTRGFWSYACGTWLEFLLQRCRDYVQIPNASMGYYVSKNATGAYFLQTEASAPYAKGPLLDIDLEVNERVGNELNEN